MDIKLKIQYYLQLQKNKIWDLYAENYKMLMKEINEDLKKKNGETVFMDWKTQHNKDVSSPQINLSV